MTYKATIKTQASVEVTTVLAGEFDTELEAVMAAKLFAAEGKGEVEEQQSLNVVSVANGCWAGAPIPSDEWQAKIENEEVAGNG